MRKLFTLSFVLVIFCKMILFFIIREIRQNLNEDMFLANQLI